MIEKSTEQKIIPVQILQGRTLRLSCPAKLRSQILKTTLRKNFIKHAIFIFPQILRKAILIDKKWQIFRDEKLCHLSLFDYYKFFQVAIIKNHELKKKN